MPQHTTPRQPLSCENCRKRKIKCSGGQAPCTTCVKRRQSQSCYYKRYGNMVPQSTASDLLDRIRNLEDMLKQPNANVQSHQSPSEPVSASTPTWTDDSSLDEQPTNPKRRQCGTIITSHTGHQYFSPRTSVSDADFVHELVGSVPSAPGGTNFPFVSDPVYARDTLLDGLPPLQQCDELKQVFFGVFSPLFHVLHDPTFDAMYDRFRLEQSTLPLSGLALLFVVLAIAVTAMEEDHQLLRDLGRETSAIANMRKLSARYRSAAMQCLAADQLLYQHNLQTLQALLLLIYAMNHANISSWALLGMTLNIAIRIGCHIDPSRLGLGIIESEERRRCWAALMMLYTIQSTCLGVIAPQMVTADVELPADKDDDDLECCDLTNNTRDPRMCQRSGPSKMSYILCKFRLYEIAAEICQLGPSGEIGDPRVILMLDQKLASQEQKHASRFTGRDLPMYHVAHHYILQSYTHHLYLILHKWSLNSLRTGDPVALKSRMRCKTSAKKILEIHCHLYHAADFRPYRWYVCGLGSFHAFLATSILIILLSSTQIADADCAHLSTLVEQCMQRFESMADRSDVCARAVVILRRVLQKRNQDATALHVEAYHASLLQEKTLHQYPVSPVSNSGYYATSTYDWTSNHNLEALLFDMAPQQWMAPSSFVWDQWDNTMIP